MTPFGERMRELRRERGVTQKEMAQALGVTPAYLSALEHGRRGVPNWAMLQKIVGYFHIIWDDAEDMQRLAEASHPRVVIDTTKLSAGATLVANRLAARIDRLSEEELEELLARLNEMGR